MTLTFGSLFSGIGGIDLGLERAGMRSLWMVEKDPYARRVLAKHWPAVPCYEDVRHVHAKDDHWVCGFQCDGLAPVDLICGGFPCQDISLAGKGAGIKEGTRSGLWSEYLRIVREVRPRYVLVENVAALRSRGLDRVLGDLASSGYDAEWDCIPAAAVGAPHRRDRIFVIAYSNADGQRLVADAERSGLEVGIFQSAREELAAAQRGCLPGNPWAVVADVDRGPHGFPHWLDRHIGRGLNGPESYRRVEALRQMWSPDVAQALWSALGGLGRVQQAEILYALVREFEAGSRPIGASLAGEKAQEAALRIMQRAKEAPRASRRPEPREQLGGESPDALPVVPRLPARNSETAWPPCGWEDGVSRVAHGVVKRVDRLRCLGNAVVPQVAEYVGRLILAHAQSGARNGTKP